MKNLEITVDEFAFFWFTKFFPDLPLTTRFRVFDCYINEGKTVLMRIAVAILSICAHSLKVCNDSFTFLETLKLTCVDLRDADKLISVAFAFTSSIFSERDLIK